VALGLFGLLGCSTVKQAKTQPENARYEYRIQVIHGEEASEYTINTLTASGWTFVSLSPRNSETGTFAYTLVFQRLKKGDDGSE